MSCVFPSRLFPEVLFCEDLPIHPARTLLGAPGLTTSNKKLLVTKGITTRSILAISNKKLVETSATLLGTSALLVVTRFATRFN